MYDMRTLGLAEMIQAGRILRTMNGHSDCMEAAASHVVDFFYDRFRGPANLPACVLARCFKTHRFGNLPPALSRRAILAAGQLPLNADTQCLTLLASRGERLEWNSRHTSNKHQAIPLATVAMVSQAPMIFELILQLGLTPEEVVQPSAHRQDRNDTFGVFHVPEAHGSPMVPEQADFVDAHAVASVLGFGGLLPANELFAVILFSRVPISSATAALFRTLALGVKLNLLPFSGKRVFQDAADESQVSNS